GFSTFWIQTVLRGELHFNGTVFSDDLSMEGAAGAGTFAERANLALAAGCDMVLVCNNPAAAEQVLEEVPIIGRPLGARRLEAMRGKPALSWEQLHASEQWRSLSTRISELAHDYD
ncbi:MAG: glycoside hydrolase family 3 N-terminal domain-containing protein, partial [Gammaproteobacteria bacterium]